MTTSKLEYGSFLGRRGWLALTLALLFGVSACQAEGETDPEEQPEAAVTEEVDLDDLEEVTITWPGGVGPEHWSAQGVQAWAAEIEELSEGRIEFDFHWSGSLGPLLDHATMLEDGIADVGEIYLPFDSSFQAADWIASLGWYQQADPLLGDLQAYAATVEWGLEDVARQEFEERGLVPIIPNIQVISNHAMICREAWTTLDELQGRSVRVPGPVVGAEAEAIGLSPTQIPGPETYEALQRGVIDCSIAHPRDMTAYGLDEVAPHIIIGSDVGFSGFMGQGVYTSQAFWDDLQPEARQILWDAIPAYLEGHMTAALEEDLVAFQSADTISDYGNEVVDALDAHQQQVLQEMADQAPQAVEDPSAAIDRFVEIYDTWAQDLEDHYGDWPGDWSGYIDAYDQDRPDLEPWLSLVQERVLEPNRP